MNEVYRVAGSAVGNASRIEVVSVDDPAGQAFAQQVRALQQRRGEHDGPTVWDDIIDIAAACRWRTALQPAPPAGSEGGVAHAVACLRDEAHRIRPGLGTESQQVLGQTIAAAEQLRDSVPAVGSAVLDALLQRERRTTCVVCARGWASDLTSRWLTSSGLEVSCLTAAQLLAGTVWGNAALIGPPWMFGREILTCPRAHNMTFFQPAWLAGVASPAAVLDAVAEQHYRPVIHVVALKRDARRQAIQVPPLELAIEPRWPEPATTGIDPIGAGLVACRRVLLAGGYRVMLDTGGSRIRSLEPAGGPARHVSMLDSALVGRGSILVLRKDASETGALHTMAIAALGEAGQQIESDQAHWKRELESWLARDGTERVRSVLRARGVHHDRRATAWTDADLIRPSSDRDFRLLLEALDFGPTIDRMITSANTLRREHQRAAVRLTATLERRLEGSDLDQLERYGHMRIALDLPGISAMTASTVLAISPHEELVPPRDVRAMRTDRSARWLE